MKSATTLASIQQLLDETDNKLGRHFAYLIQGLIILSLVTFSIDTLPDLTTTTKQALYYIEVFTIFVFSIEYVLRLSTANNKLNYIFSFNGLIDLAAILPFYLATSIDLRAIRAFRLLRLLRILKLLKYTKAINRFKRAFNIAKEELVIFGCIALILLFLSAVGVYHFENAAQPEQFKSIFHSLWWAVTTLTTVGYGDMYPITSGGKFFTFFVLMIGLGVVAIPTGLVASALSKAREEEQ